MQKHRFAQGCFNSITYDKVPKFSLSHHVLSLGELVLQRNCCARAPAMMRSSMRPIIARADCVFS
eukprot:6210649-Pleurochrysis_carterae.AAC.10